MTVPASTQFYLTYSFLLELGWGFRPELRLASESVHEPSGAHGVLRLNRPAASTTVPAMKKSILLVLALSVVVMALVSCASNSYDDPFRVNTEPTTPAYHEPAPAHSNIGGVPE